MRKIRFATTARWVLAPMLAGGVLIGTALTTASTASATSATGTRAKVVAVADRSPVGNMLVTNKGLSLYIHPGGACTGGCLKVWPALLMPGTKTVPGGAKCLSTAAFGKKGRLQVTYQSQPLYTFVDDSGTSVNGNGVAGFEAATVSSACP